MPGVGWAWPSASFWGLKRAFSSRLRGNILQRGSLRWSRPDRQAGACHLVEVAGNRTSKNEKWQDIDLLIAVVQTHRCEGQEEGVCGGGGSGYQSFTSDRETQKKREKREIYQLIASPEFLFHFLHVLYSNKGYLKKTKNILKRGLDYLLGCMDGS